MDFKPDAEENKDANFQPENQMQPAVPEPMPTEVQPQVPDAMPMPYEALETEPATEAQGAAPFGPNFSDAAPSQPVAPTDTAAPVASPQYGAVAPLSTPPIATASPKGKKKLFLVIAGIFLLVATIGTSVLASYRFYQSPETVMIGAVSQLMRADHIQANTIITSDQVTEFGDMTVAIKKVTINNKTDYTPANGSDAEIELSVNDKSYKFGGSVMNVASGDIYFKLNDVVSTVEKIALESDQQLNLTILKELENKWVKFAVADMKKLSAEYGDTYKCTLDAYKQYGTDKAMTDEVINAYRVNQFITLKGDAKYKDGMIGYDVEIEKQKLKDFSKAFQKTAIYKKVAACDKTDTVPESDESSTSDPVDEAIDEVESDYTTVNTLWFGQWTHELRQLDSTVEYTPKNEKASTTQVSVVMGYDETVKIEAPKDAMSFEDFQKKVTEGYEQMLNMPSGGIEARAQDSSSEASVNTISKKAEAYNAMAGTYPATIADFEKYPESSLKGGTIVADGSIVTALPVSEKQYTYKRCAVGVSAQVVYKKSDGTFVAKGLGGAPTGVITKLC